METVIIKKNEISSLHFQNQRILVHEPCKKIQTMETI